MKFALLFLLCLSLNLCYAQRITYQDLKYVLFHGVDESGDYLLKKGLSYGGVDTLGEDHSGISYQFSKNSPHTKQYLAVRKLAKNNVFYSASVFTIDENDYVKLKQSLKLLDFVFKSTDTDSGSLITKYIKGNLTVEFTITRESDKETTDYYITLKNKDFEDKAWGNL